MSSLSCGAIRGGLCCVASLSYFILFGIFMLPLEAVAQGYQAGIGKQPTMSPEEVRQKLRELGVDYQEPAVTPSDPQEKSRSEAMPATTKCECMPSDEIYCRADLTGFKPGAFTHPGLENFARSIGLLLHIHEISNQPPVLRLIKIIGQTDGLENRGVCCWRDLLVAEKECGSMDPEAAMSRRLFEKELGLARACVARKALERVLREVLPELPKDWRSSNEDIETGGAIGDLYRKVTMEIWIKEGCEYGRAD